MLKKNNLKNKQILETCGVEIFKKIQRKKVIADAKGSTKGLLNIKQLLDKK